MIRSTILLLAVVTAWALMADDADARHRRLGRRGCAGHVAVSCAGVADYGCAGCAGVADCAGEHTVIVRRRVPRRIMRAAVVAPVVVVTAPVRRYRHCENGVCTR